MEKRPLVVQRLAGLPAPLLARAEAEEVLGRFGHHIREELEMDPTHRAGGRIPAAT